MTNLDDQINKLLSKATNDNKLKQLKTEKANIEIKNSIKISDSKINIISGGTLITILLLICAVFFCNR